MKKIKIIIYLAIPLIAIVVIYTTNNTILGTKNQTKAVTQNLNSIQEESSIINKIITSNNIQYEKFFVPVTSFSSLNENISSDNLKKVFTEKQDIFKNVYVLSENQKELESYFKTKPNASSINSVDELSAKIQKDDIALIPFDKLTPNLKIIFINNQNILDKNIESSKLVYPKIISTIKSDKNEKTETNRNANKLNQLVMTGVTAISRTVQKMIDIKNDPIYPARAVMDELKKADLTHVSSENSFFDGCPENPADDLTLCAKTKSLESLKAIGADIVDLNGNHQTDFGLDKFLESIGHIDNAGLEYFGGGKNENDAAKILYKTIGDAKIAFLSYAYFDSLNGKAYRNIANGDRPGVNFFEIEKVKADIKNAKQKADFVIVDYQFTESYNIQPLPEQKNIFRETIDFGADLVFGVQAHQPQKIEFYNGKIIFYGLGNFFFDQMWSQPTRQGIIPRFTFYNGKLISIEILTTLLYDYSQPRFTNGNERMELLQDVLP
ncbi:MAG TPA: CapA family protein [Patescibacteria group bacterium]|nr:CapA family protein [Patescibacteria group bacterium]